MNIADTFAKLSSDNIVTSHNLKEELTKFKIKTI